MKVKFKLKKSSRVYAGLIAGAAFIALAIKSWGLSVETAVTYLLICLAALLIIVALAAIIALLIRILQNNRSN